MKPSERSAAAGVQAEIKLTERARGATLFCGFGLKRRLRSANFTQRGGYYPRLQSEREPIWRTGIGLDPGSQEVQEVQIGQFWCPQLRQAIAWTWQRWRRVEHFTVPVLAGEIRRYQGNIRPPARLLGGCQLRGLLE